MASKNDAAWVHILEDDGLNIIDSVRKSGYCDVSADQLKEIGAREPRLLCKHDFRRQIPKPLHDVNLSVLAIRNGTYRIAHTDPYFDMKLDNFHRLPRKPCQMPEDIEFLQATSISSESKAMDAAKISGMLQDAFGESDDPELVIRGRERTSQFEFVLPEVKRTRGSAIPYEIDGVTIEIDGGYEGKEGLHLVEAKTFSDQTCMNLRQILYPFLHFRNIAKTKKVIPYVMFFDGSQSCFSFYRYAFRLIGDVPLFQRVAEKHYRLLDREPERRFGQLQSLEINHNLLNLEAPFPQADSFSKVIAIYATLLHKGPRNTDELFSDYDITHRQHDYYGNALRWLDLAEKYKNVYQVTKLGRGIGQLSKSHLLFEMGKLVFSNDVFNAWINGKERLAATLLSRYPNINKKSTVQRRLKTVRAWTEYFRSAFS